MATDQQTESNIKDATQKTRYANHAEHTFGRFRVASFKGMDLGVLVRHVDTPVYVIRLRNAGCF